ncbi:hypothetical protein A5893_15585 [Pedobacter psychrophilus]|uniref:Carboxypeptidase-like regulatory domain-containing protein n=1 Tax=Pedobacter psychrophilus TaxID=1826909 RepID=A0A179DB10_9SPHI|nr:hypothetical protein [Pedobacter psychrophilus]OAQ38217.1 hypothetical protein A5893_15585 [Pedobacter psychrophilus]
MKQTLKAIYLLLFFILKCSIAFCQDGKYQIVDKETGRGVSYALIKSNDVIVNSDSLGHFILPLNLSFIQISCIGYETKKFQSNELKQIIKLIPISYILNEVSVNPLTFKSINSKFNSNFYDNLVQKPYDANFFYREFTKLDGDYIDFNESFGLYHFEGFSLNSLRNLSASSFISKINQIKSLNIMMDKKMGLHEINWLAAPNNLNKYILEFLMYFGGDLSDRKLSNNYFDGKEHIAEISFKPNPKRLNYLISKQWRRFNFFAGVLASSGTYYVNTDNGKLKRVIFDTHDFNKSARGYNKMDERFKILNLSGEINYIEDENSKTIPSFLGCNITYILKDEPTKKIEKRLEFYFSGFDFKNQSNEDLAKKYNTGILYEFPSRAMRYKAENIFPGEAKYDPVFWAKDLPYPPFYDIKKVKEDLAKQGIDMQKKFAEFNNTYK